MKTFVLAITTFNRLNYLKGCIASFKNTKSNDVNWTLIVADDGSDDGTLDYLNTLKIENTSVNIIINKRLGVHQQMNTILSFLENVEYDFCFKIDDDLSFLKPGWDNLYYKTALETGNHHLVFCDENWCQEQFLKQPVKAKNLVGNVPILHAHGFFYTFTPQAIKKVGFIDVNSFGFRGMGHVDLTMRFARAGYTNQHSPWDIENSNHYISATKHNYKSVLPSIPIHVYDGYWRKNKENTISQKNRLYISKQPLDNALYAKFKENLIEALSDAVINDRAQLALHETQEHYNKVYENMPPWWKKLGALIRKV